MNKGQIKKNIYPKLGLNNEIENKLEFTKWLTTKIKNQNNKDQSGNLYKSGDNSKILHGQCESRREEREKKGKVLSITNHATNDNVSFPMEEDIAALLIT